MPLETFRHRARRPFAVAASTVLLGTSIAYAAGDVGRPKTPSDVTAAAAGAISLADDDGGRPMFDLPAMGPGQTTSSCIAVTNTSPVPVDLRLHTRRTGTLDRFMRLDVERGARTSAAFNSCDGFEPAAMVWSGSLDEFPSEGAAGVADGALAAGARRVYRFTASVVDDNAAQDRSANVSFSFSGTGEPPVEPVAPAEPQPQPLPEPQPQAEPVPAPAPVPQPAAAAPAPAAPAAEAPVPLVTAPGQTCTTYSMARPVQRTVAITGRVRAALRISQIGRGTRNERLRLNVALKTAGGKTLINRGWANVTILRNGKLVAQARKRPFTALLKPGTFRTGVNRVQIVIRNRHGQTTRATFRLNLGTVRVGTQTSCVIAGDTPTPPRGR
jgi:hypothetical protein